MTQITTTLYRLVAEDYSNVWEQLQLISDGTTRAVNNIVDVTSTGYAGGAAAAVEIELALLGPFNAAATSMTNMVASTSSLLDAVRAINSHVINNTSGTDTAKVKLDTWVNVTMLTLWHSGVPNGWEELSSDAGYDTSDWNINPSIVFYSA